MRDFVRWYNDEHRHSRIRFVMPSQRHRGEDAVILEARDALYRKAKEDHPRRWSGNTRNWCPIADVQLNPDRSLKDAA